MNTEEKQLMKDKNEAVSAYSKYVREHISYVHLAFISFGDKICNDLEARYNGVHDLYNRVRIRVMKHDNSKFSDDEFIPYVQKFYAWKGMDKTQEQVDEEFNKAFIHHTKCNDHHPEHWIEWSEIQKRNISIAMDDEAIVEMLLDWIAMSMARNQSVYKWWTTDNGGREEKKSLMDKMDFKFVDQWIEDNKDLINFSNRNTGDK